MRGHKIDSMGNYMTFPGYTVISKVNLNTSNLWRELSDTLSNNEKIRGKFALLPLDSWHMTAINLFVKSHVEGSENSWPEVVRSNQPFFTELSASLESQAIEPNIQYNGLILGSVIQLALSVDKETVQKIQAVAMYYGCEDLVPRPFHITLAYQYDNLSHKAFEALKTELTKLFAEHFSETRIILAPPKLCYFEDMTDFRPWQKNSLYLQARYPGGFLNSEADKKDSSAEQDSQLDKKPG